MYLYTQLNLTIDRLLGKISIGDFYSMTYKLKSKRLPGLKAQARLIKLALQNLPIGRKGQS